MHGDTRVQRRMEDLYKVSTEVRKIKFCLLVSQDIWQPMLLGWDPGIGDDRDADSSSNDSDSYDRRCPLRFNPNPLWALTGSLLRGGQCSKLLRSVRQNYVFGHTDDVVLMVIIAFSGPWREWLERFG